MAKKQRKEREWPGDLGKRIPLPLPSQAVSDLDPDNAEQYLKRERRKVWAEIVIPEQLQKLKLLADHYGLALQETNFLPLLLRVCYDCIPGFQIEYVKPKRKGRPTKWNDFRNLRLMDHVDKTKAAKNCTDKEALRWLQKWKMYRSCDIRNSADTIDKRIANLETRLSEARRKKPDPLIVSLFDKLRECGILDVLDATLEPGAATKTH